MATHILCGSDLSSHLCSCSPPATCLTTITFSLQFSHFSSSLFPHHLRPALLTPYRPLYPPLPAPPSLGSQRRSIKRLSDFLRALPRSCYAPQSYETVRTLLQGLPGSIHRGGMGPPSAAGTVSSIAGCRGRYPLMMLHVARGNGAAKCSRYSLSKLALVAPNAVGTVSIGWRAFTPGPCMRKPLGPPMRSPLPSFLRCTCRQRPVRSTGQPGHRQPHLHQAPALRLHNRCAPLS